MRFVMNDIRGLLKEALTTETERPMAVAAREAMWDVADLAVREGRHNIALAGFRDGYFPWQKALTFKVYPGDKPSLRPAARIDHRVYIATVFEHGSTIQPRKRQLLWLPLSRNLPTGFRGGPRKFPGNLRSVRRASGPPLLVGRPAGGNKNVPLFVGIPSAQLRKRFDLYATFQRAADRLGEFYLKNLKT